MNRSSATLASQSVAVALWATRHADVKHISAALPTGKRLQRSARIRLFMLMLIACFAQPTGAITLEHVLQTTLEKNPAIQEAKFGLEQAAGRRLVFRSVVWPHAELGAPAGVQAGHRAGESGVKGFLADAGCLPKPWLTLLCPPCFRLEALEVFIAQQQLNLALLDR